MLVKTKNVIELPIGSTILSCQEQDGRIAMWAMVTDRAVTERIFCVYATGEMFDAEHKNYIGTVQRNGLVWHIFENLNP